MATGIPNLEDQLWRTAAGGQAVPGMTVYEPGEPTPGNPRVRPGALSPEAQAFQQSRAAAQSATTTASTVRPSLAQGLAGEKTLASKALYGGGRTAASAVGLARGFVGPVAVGGQVMGHFNDYKINDPDTDSSAAGTWNYLKAGDFAGAGRSLSKGALEAGMDVGSAAANLADFALPGKNTASGAYDRFLRDRFGDQLRGPESSTAQPSSASSILAPSDMQAVVGRSAANPSPASSNGSPATPNELTAPAPQMGNAAPLSLASGILRNGSSYSGMNIGQDLPGARDTSLGSMADTQTRLANLQASNSRITGGATVIDGAGAAADARNQFFEQANLRNALNRTLMTRRGPVQDELAVRAAMEPIAQRAQSQLESQRGQAQAREATLRNQATLAEAGMRDATDRRGQDISANTAANQQAVSLRGQDMTARTAATQARIEQANKDRQYQLDVQKFGTETADKNRTARAAEQKAVDDNLTGMFRTRDDKGNDVADTAKVAQFKQALVPTMQAIIASKRAQGKEAEAQQLEDRGLAALGPEQFAQLKQLYDTRERVRQSRSLLRGGASYVDSDNLLDFSQAPGSDGVAQRTLGGDRVRMRGGSEVSVNDLRYTEPSNAVLPDWFKVRDRDLTRGLRTQ